MSKILEKLEEKKKLDEKYFDFKVLYKSKISNARVGQIKTPHGIIDTPAFVGVGTNGTIKAIDNQIVDDISLQLMFCNTYHLLLQPGTKVIKNAGGIHKFINRKGPIITDSGGFQVFSLNYGSVTSELKKTPKKKDGSVLKVDEEGVLFRSYRDGSLIKLTPEKSIQAQKDIGADIIIPFDELLPYHVSEKKLLESLNRTHRWEERSLLEHKKNVQNQAMYAVIHGGVNHELREKSLNFLTNLDFDGFAIGGSVGKTKDEMIKMLEFTIPKLPFNKPNHLLGIGDLSSLEMCMPIGIDTFDSSYPTKAARHGLLFSDDENIKIAKKKYFEDFSKICKNCLCYTCQNYSKAYLHHLFKANELTFYTLASIHNLTFMVNLMKKYREKILMDLI